VTFRPLNKNKQINKNKQSFYDDAVGVTTRFPSDRFFISTIVGNQRGDARASVASCSAEFRAMSFASRPPVAVMSRKNWDRAP
jgi:hypothetical protein